jgi:hypothetical protein
MKDIAADLGVSAVTVSKVLRNQGRISTGMRERVLQRIKELNYEPNLAARSLVGGRTFLIGLIVPDLTHPFFAAIAKALSGNLRTKGYALAIASSEEDCDLEAKEISAFHARRVDALNQRVRSSAQPALAFVSQMVGVASAAQPVTRSNTGTATIAVSTITFAGAFITASGGTCSATPITLAPGASCTEEFAYLPTAVGATSGSVVFGGSGIVPDTVLLAGTGSVASNTTTLTSSVAAPFINQPISFTATAQRSGAGTPTGTVTFYANGVAISTAQPLNNGSASATTSFTTSGTYSITAIYLADANDSGSVATALTQSVSDFSLTIIPEPSNPGGSVNQTVQPGQSATFNFTVVPLNGPFTVPITLSATGLPPELPSPSIPQTVTPVRVRRPSPWSCIRPRRPPCWRG